MNILRNTPPIVRNLIIINTILLIATTLTGDFFYKYLSLFYFESPLFKPYQILTHMFMHGGFFHLFFNMYTLWIFGSVLENMWGSKKFFTYYMITGLGAAIIHSLVQFLQLQGLENELAQGAMSARIGIETIMRTPTVGASGAIYGLLLAYGMLFPNNRIQLLFPPVALKAKWFVLIFGAIELSLGITNTGGNIAHFAHLGGMIFGVIMILYWKKNNRLYY